MNLLNNYEASQYNEQKYQHIPDDILHVQYISYRIVLPLMIISGMAFSTLSGIVLNRSRLKTTHINTYFLLLAASDFIVFVVNIPTVKTLNGCNLRSYNYALYFVHVFFTFFYIIQCFSLYLILWISYDRFLAIWNFKRFSEIQKPGVIRVRLICTAVMCVVIHLEHLFSVRVTCSSRKSCDYENGKIDDNPNCKVVGHLKYSCDDGIWLINDGLRHMDEKSVWHQLFWALRGLIVSAIPIFLVVFLNLGIVVAVLRQRFKSTSSSSRTQRRDLSRMYIILGISASFICCTAPSLIHAAFYAKNIDNCYGPYSEEIFRALSNLLLLLEHMTHFIILCCNIIFWEELKIVLCITSRNLKNSLRRLTQKFSSSSKPNGGNESKASAGASSALKKSQNFPPTITIVMDHRDPEKDTVTMTMSTEVSGSSSSSQTTTPYNLQPPERSPTASMLTLEEILREGCSTDT